MLMPHCCARRFGDVRPALVSEQPWVVGEEVWICVVVVVGVVVVVVMMFIPTARVRSITFTLV